MSCEQIYSILPSAILGIAGVIVTVTFAWSAKKREHDKIMKELFTEFNARYDKLNGPLSGIIDPENAFKEGMLKYTGENSHSVIIDYFNLCAEEYFWYKKGRIDKKVWKSWSYGMNYWYNHTNPIIREFWQEEIEKKNGPESYYITKGDEFFKEQI